jgi:hypothetical protein
MSSSSQRSLQIIDIGAPGWCWSQLGAGGEGILSYQAPRGRISLAVPYAVTDRRISIALASFNETGWRAAGADTQLEVSGLTPDDLRWVVRATGLAERVDLSGRSGLAYARRVHPANRAGSGSVGSSDRLFLRTPRVRGFYETSLPD